MLILNPLQVVVRRHPRYYTLCAFLTTCSTVMSATSLGEYVAFPSPHFREPCEANMARGRCADKHLDLCYGTHLWLTLTSVVKVFYSSVGHTVQSSRHRVKKCGRVLSTVGNTAIYGGPLYRYNGCANVGCRCCTIPQTRPLLCRQAGCISSPMPYMGECCPKH